MSDRIQNVQPKEYNGIKFRSTLEAKTAKTLDDLKVPYKYEERKITLQEGFRCPYQKDKVREVSYTPDFEVGPILLECKGFETPEWKLKKKLVYKYLIEKEPNTKFYQVKDCKKGLITALDDNWNLLGLIIKVISKPTRKNPTPTAALYGSIKEAMKTLNLQGKPVGPILKALTGEKDFVYGYKWDLITLKL